MRRPARGPRVALAQIAPALGDAAANMERHRSAIERAAGEGADLLVFPELSLAGYRLKDSVPDVGIKRGSDTWKELEQLSEKVAFVAGFVEETPEHLFYNSAAYFEGGRCVSVHRKTYLPTYGMFDEQRYFARGRSIAAFDTKIGRVAMLICEDMLHPSALTIAACDGATLVVCPSASPARGVIGEGEADANARSWESYLQAMARSFGVWVAYCNRVGVEDGVTFWGGAEIVSPAGERLAKGAYYDEDFVSGVLSDDAVRRRRIVNPLVRDEDLDLTINELSRIRGRAVPEEKEETRPRFAARDGDAPPRRFDRPPPRFDREDDREHRPPPSFRPRAPFEQRGGFGRPRRDDQGEGGPRFGGGGRFDRGKVARPDFGAQGSDAPRGRFQKRDDDAPRGRFQKRDDGAPRGRFQKRDDGAPRGRFQKRDDEGRFQKRDDDASRGRFGAPRPKFGTRSDDAPRGGGFGPPRDREERGGGGGAFKPRFGAGPRPRERERPDSPRKSFPKSGPPRGRKDR